MTLSMAKKIKLEEPIAIKQVLEQVFKNLDMDGKMDDYKVMQAWNSFLSGAAKPAMAKKLKEYTFAHRITRERILVIGVRSAVMANELQFMKAMLENKFKELIQEQQLPEISGIVFELRA